MENFKKLLEQEKSISPKERKRLLEFIKWCKNNNPDLIVDLNNMIDLSPDNKIKNMNLIIDLLDLYKKYRLNFLLDRL